MAQFDYGLSMAIMKFSRSIKDVATLAAGKSVATGISIVSMPVISRLFTPDVYGLAALYVSITTVLVTVGILSLPQAIVLPKDDEKAAQLIGLTGIGLFIVAVVLWLLMLVAELSGVVISPQLGIWVWSLPLAMCLRGVQQVGDNWLTRQRKFRRSAAGDVVQSLLTSGTRVVFGVKFGEFLWPLIGSYLLGQIGRLFLYRNIFPTTMVRRSFWSRKKLLTTAREYRHFPIYNMPASLVFALNAQLPVLAISYLFSPRDVGHYAMVQGLLVTTTMMAGESVRRVYLHRASQSGLTSAQLRRDYRRTLRLMAAVALPPVVLLMVFGEPLFAVALGREWADAGKYAAVLSPWFYFQWLSMPASALVVSLKRQRFWLYFQHAVLFGQLLGIIIGYLSGGGVIFVLAGYMVARSVSLLFLIVSVDSMIAKRSANL